MVLPKPCPSCTASKQRRRVASRGNQRRPRWSHRQVPLQPFQYQLAKRLRHVMGVPVVREEACSHSGVGRRKTHALWR